MIESAYKIVEEPQSPAERDALTRDEAQLIIAQRNEISARATLVESLVLLGAFDAALAINTDPAQEKLILKMQKAELRDENHRCNCVATIDTQDYVRFGEDAPPKKVQVANYINTLRFWSREYGKMTTFYQCSECGCVQALPDGMSISDLNDQRQAKAEAALSQALAQGIRVRKL